MSYVEIARNKDNEVLYKQDDNHYKVIEKDGKERYLDGRAAPLWTQRHMPARVVVDWFTDDTEEAYISAYVSQLTSELIHRLQLRMGKISKGKVLDYIVAQYLGDQIDEI